MASGTVLSRDAVLEPPGMDLRRVSEAMPLPLPLAPKPVRNSITSHSSVKSNFPSYVLRKELIIQLKPVRHGSLDIAAGLIVRQKQLAKARVEGHSGAR